MDYFYNGITKTYIIGFSKLFSNVFVKRTNSSDQVIKTIKVPIIFASKSKLSYLLQANDSTGSARLVTPVISFNIEGLEFAPDRNISSLNDITVDDNESMYEGIPYNYNFSVNIRTKYQDDYWQILEQVLYLFKPDITLDVKELPYPDYVRDITINLNSVALDNELDMTQDEDSSRGFIASLEFTLRGFIYPASTTDKIIEHIEVNMTDSLDHIMTTINHDFIDPDIITTITH